MTANEKLRDWIETGGRRRDWVAAQIGVHRNTVALWLAGDLRPDGDNRVKLEKLTAGAVAAADWVA